jgi:hypothetical protein
VGREPRASIQLALECCECLRLVYLVEVDYGLPELVLHLVEVSHSDFTEVTWMILVEIGAVVMLATSHTATTGVLAVLAYTTMTG